MSDGLVLRDATQGVAIVTLNAPDRLNALSTAMLDALREALLACAADRSLRAVVLRGAGRAFCAGHDLREIQSLRTAEDGGRAAFDALFSRCAEVMQLIPRLPQPVIAQVQGIATAAGCQLVASCDMAIAADTARFGVNGIDVGLFCSTPMVALSRNIPRKAAFEMLSTGRFVTAIRAEELGLINRAVPPEMLEAETLALARTVASKLGPAMRIGKDSFYQQLDLPTEAAYALANRAIVENLMRDDTSEGLDAFLQKRAPDWSQD